MQVVWGTVVVVLSLLCWGGQTASWFAPKTAAKLTLTEAEGDVEPTYWVDIRGEALWDVFTLWIMLAAGVLLLADNPSWPYFGLVGGGIYLYFAGRGIVTRALMIRHGVQIGAPENVKLGFIFLGIWGVMAIVTIIAAAAALS